MIRFNPDKSVFLQDDANPTRTQTIAATATNAERESAIVNFFGPYVPVERDGWSDITPRNLVVSILAGFRNANKITAAEGDSMRDFIIERLKR
jgi:hypothetical protein